MTRSERKPDEHGGQSIHKEKKETLLSKRGMQLDRVSLVCHTRRDSINSDFVS